jgi:hypothetical protein
MSKGIPAKDHTPRKASVAKALARNTGTAPVANNFGADARWQRKIIAEAKLNETMCVTHCAGVRLLPCPPVNP